MGGQLPPDNRPDRSADQRVPRTAGAEPLLPRAGAGCGPDFTRPGRGRRHRRSAAARFGSRFRPAARGPLLFVPGLPVHGARRAAGRLLGALPRADGGIPRIHPHRPAGARRPARGPDLVATRIEVGSSGTYPQRRDLRPRGGPARRSRLLHGRRRERQAIPDEMARSIVLQSGRAAAYHPGAQGGGRRRDHGFGGSGVRRGGSCAVMLESVDAR